MSRSIAKSKGLPGSGLTLPKYGPNAQPLSQDHAFLKKHSAQIFWSIICYYIPQQYLWSCGITSICMVVNAIRARLKVLPRLGSEDPLVHEDDLIQVLSALPEWREKKSHFERYGITLEELTSFTKEAIQSFGIYCKTIQKFQPQVDNKSSRILLRNHLKRMMTKSDSFMIANFNQKHFTGDAELGHFAPVVAYDEKKRKVLLFDPDRKWYEPYWVSEEVFLLGMDTEDKISGDRRGYIWIESVNTSKR